MLTPYQVVVVSAAHGKQQLLLAHDAHYDVITKLNAYFGVILVCNAEKATKPRKEVATYPSNKELPGVTQRLPQCTVAASRAVQKHFNEMKCRLFPTTALHFVTDN